jgi:hypothetical protein
MEPSLNDDAYAHWLLIQVSGRLRKLPQDGQFFSGDPIRCVPILFAGGHNLPAEAGGLLVP